MTREATKAHQTCGLLPCFMIVNAPIFLGSLTDSLSTYVAIDSGFGKEANPFFGFVDSSGDILIFFGILPLLVSTLSLLAVIHRERIVTFLKNAGNNFLLSTYKDDTNSQYFFLVSTIPSAVGLAKLIAAANNSQVILYGYGFLFTRAFPLIGAILFVLIVVGSFYLTRTLFLLTRKT